MTGAADGEQLHAACTSTTAYRDCTSVLSMSLIEAASLNRVRELTMYTVSTPALCVLWLQDVLAELLPAVGYACDGGAQLR